MPTVISWYDAIEDFQIHLEGSRAPKTVKFYRTQLRQLAKWAEDNEVRIDKFGKRDMDKYLAERARTVSATTLCHDGIAAVAFFKWCARNEIVRRSFLSDYQVRKAPRPPQHMPTEDEVRALLRAIKEYYDPNKNKGVNNCGFGKRQFHRERNYAIILGLLDTACRIGEMLALKMEDYKPDEKRIQIRQSKGRTSRTIPISDEWIEALTVWLRIRVRVMASVPPNEDEGYLFVSELGGKVDESKFLGALRRWTRFAGLSDELKLHSLRRYSLNRLAKTNVLGAQRIAGHKNPMTTMLYTELDAGHVREVHERAGVLSDIVSSKRTPRRKRLL